MHRFLAKAAAGFAGPLLALGALPEAAAAQRPDSLGPAVRAVLATDAPVIALTHVKLIDGTGKPARDDQTVVIENGRITAVGSAGAVKVPATDAPVIALTHVKLIDGTGKPARDDQTVVI